MATAYDGKLRSNEIFSSIYNMIISQEVESDNIAGDISKLVDRARVDGGLYGDTKLYYSTDILKVNAWDAKDHNVLEQARPKAPSCQSIVLDKFYQIPVTVDNYLSKRAYQGEGTFAQINGIFLGWLQDTKKIFDSVSFNCFIGTHKSEKQPTVTVTNDEIAASSLGQAVACDVAKLVGKLKDATRDYNELGFRRAYAEKDLVCYVNADYLAEITKVNLPAIFHKDGLLDLLTGSELQPRFFGDVKKTSGTATGVERSLVALAAADGEDQILPGDLLPSGTTYNAYEAYVPDEKVIGVVTTKDSVPYMSAFEVGTEFFNPKSLTENHYLTFGRNTIEALDRAPWVVISKE